MVTEAHNHAVITLPACLPTLRAVMGIVITLQCSERTGTRMVHELYAQIPQPDKQQDSQISTTYESCVTLQTFSTLPTIICRYTDLISTRTDITHRNEEAQGWKKRRKNNEKDNGGGRRRRLEKFNNREN